MLLNYGITLKHIFKHFYIFNVCVDCVIINSCKGTVVPVLIRHYAMKACVGVDV
jgi:hypothetical protein